MNNHFHSCDNSATSLSVTADICLKSFLPSSEKLSYSLIFWPVGKSDDNMIILFVGNLYGRGASDNKAPVLAWIHTVEVYKALNIVRHDEIKRNANGFILSFCSGLDCVCYRICRWTLNSSSREWRRPALTAWTTWLWLRKTHSSQMWIISSSLTVFGSVNVRRWPTEPEGTATSSPRSRDQTIHMRLVLLQQTLYFIHLHEPCIMVKIWVRLLCCRSDGP